MIKLLRQITMLNVLVLVGGIFFGSTIGTEEEQVYNGSCLSDNGCYMCNEELRDEKRLWCQEHFRYEDRCFICHPELKDTSRSWCREHNLYKDECFVCKAELNKEMQRGVKPKGCSFDSKCFICNPKLRDEGRLWCNEHYRYEDRCWLCQPQLENEDRLWCEDHFIYEDECPVCHPE